MKTKAGKAYVKYASERMRVIESYMQDLSEFFIDHSDLDVSMTGTDVSRTETIDEFKYLTLERDKWQDRINTLILMESMKK